MTAYCKICGFLYIIMGDEYTDFIVSLLENIIRDLRLRLDRSKYPICEDKN